jgi:hypothetical protein
LALSTSRRRSYTCISRAVSIFFWTSIALFAAASAVSDAARALSKCSALSFQSVCVAPSSWSLSFSSSTCFSRIILCVLSDPRSSEQSAHARRSCLLAGVVWPEEAGFPESCACAL